MQSISKELKQEKEISSLTNGSPTSPSKAKGEQQSRSLFQSPSKRQAKVEEDDSENIASFDLEDEEEDLEDGIVHSPKMIEGYAVDENKSSKQLKELIHSCLVASMSLTRNPPSHFFNEKPFQNILKTAYNISEKTFHNMNSILIHLHEKLAKEENQE